MHLLSAEEIRRRAPMPQLIESLRKAFGSKYVVPPRQVTRIPHGKEERMLLYMAAFDLEGAAAVKLATVFSDNPGRGLPTIQAVLVVFSETGSPVALLDGAMVTRLRTGAASALASSYLSRVDSTHLLIVGTGALAPYMALAHCSVRPICQASVYGRRPEQAKVTAAEIRSLVDGAVRVQVVTSLEEAVLAADIISCATSSAEPVLAGRWLRPGTFIDLVGSFSADRREADDDVVTRSRIFVDTLEGAFAEAGDLLGPLENGLIRREHIEGELADLVCARVAGRRSDSDIILFKSVGTAIEDLAAARLIVEGAHSGE